MKRLRRNGFLLSMMEQPKALQDETAAKALKQHLSSTPLNQLEDPAY
jgi:hypothetical protein